MVTEEDRLWRRGYERERYRGRMDEMIAHLGGQCVVCGTKDRLEIHHKDPHEKLFNLSEVYGHPWPKILDELRKCELRCVKHHTEHHYAEHGTISRYRGHRCRCDACRAAWGEACKRWKRDYVSRRKATKLRT